MRRIAPALALLGALAILASACASGKATGLPTEPTEAPTAAACPAEIEMTVDLKFVPTNCSVKVGTTIMWTTVAGSTDHTATSEPDAPVQFDSGIVKAGESFSFKFDTAAVVPYYCKVHTAAGARLAGAMIGTITVEAA